MAIRAVFFDIGDVLEHNPRTEWQNEWAQRLRLTRSEFDRRVEAATAGADVGTVSLDTLHERLRGALNLDASTLAVLMDDLWAEYVGTLNSDLTAYFRALRPRYRTGIISNSFIGAREREESRYGFAGMCDAIVYSHEVGARKPAPEIYALACTRLSVATAEAVLLDDKPENVEGARATGMTGVICHSTSQAIRDLDALLHAGAG